MQVTFRCPRCEAPSRQSVTVESEALRCALCEWTRPISKDQITETDLPTHCAACGCADLWRQKDFPPALGFLLVGLGALISTIFWGRYQPVAAIGVLMGFALLDLVLYALMPDVLVCYRCNTRHRPASMDDSLPRFNHELAERYRQEAARTAEHGS